MGLCILYPATTIPVALYMLQGYFSDLPRELDDAALIDGLSRSQIISRCITALYARDCIRFSLRFVIAWNEFLFAFMFLDDVDLFTLSWDRLIELIRSSEATSDGWFSVATIPVLIIFVGLSVLGFGPYFWICEGITIWEVGLGSDKRSQNERRGDYTVPTSRLYPYQWNWDSGFTALGIWQFDRERAWLEIVSLLNAQWKDGMVPHIVFRQNDPNYFPGPGVWQTKTIPSTSGHSQPPVLASIVWEMVQRGR